MPLSAERF